MKLASLATAAALATIAATACASDFDAYAPAWRGGQYSIQTGWSWPAPPSDWHNMPPELSVYVGGAAPATLTNAPPLGYFDRASEWEWMITAGQPGLLSRGGTSSLGSAGFSFIFPYWDRGLGLEPARFRLQITYDGPAPVLVAPPGQDPPMFGGDEHHLYIDQTITNWQFAGIGMGALEGTFVRGVRIDTVLLPSPGAAALMAIVALAAARRRATTARIRN